MGLIFRCLRAFVELLGAIQQRAMSIGQQSSPSNHTKQAHSPFPSLVQPTRGTLLLVCYLLSATTFAQQQIYDSTNKKKTYSSSTRQHLLHQSQKQNDQKHSRAGGL